jgi:hypothetical protein
MYTQKEIRMTGNSPMNYSDKVIYYKSIPKVLEFLKCKIPSTDDIEMVQKETGDSFAVVLVVREHFRMNEHTITASAKNFEVNKGDKDGTLSVKLNSQDAEHYVLGFQVDKTKKLDVADIKTDAVVEAVASLTTIKPSKTKKDTLEVIPTTSLDKIKADLRIPLAKVSLLATNLQHVGSSSQTESQGIIKNSLKYINFVNMLMECIPKSFRPRIVTKNGDHQLIPQMLKTIELKEVSYDSMLMTVNSMSKDNNFAKIANGHLMGKNFGDSHKYFNFIGDFKSFNLPDGDIILHTSDPQYAVAVANHFLNEDISNRDIYVGGSCNREGKRYNTILTTSLHAQKGVHFHIDPCNIDSVQGETRFFTGTRCERSRLTYVKTCEGVSYNKCSVFQTRDSGNFLPSFSMYSLSMWEVIGDTKDPVITFNAAKALVVRAACNWFMFPFIRNPFYRDEYFKLDVFGKYDFRAKPEDLAGIISSIHNDDVAEKMMRDLEESEDKEVVNKVKEIKRERELQKEVKTSNNDNNSETNTGYKSIGDLSNDHHQASVVHVNDANNDDDMWGTDD